MSCATLYCTVMHTIIIIQITGQRCCRWPPYRLGRRGGCEGANGAGGNCHERTSHPVSSSVGTAALQHMQPPLSREAVEKRWRRWPPHGSYLRQSRSASRMARQFGSVVAGGKGGGDGDGGGGEGEGGGAGGNQSAMLPLAAV